MRNAVDEKLYSRQLYVMGHEAQRRVMAAGCLVVGCAGLGAEIAKNCILAGVHSLTLVDPEPPTAYDLGGNFYLTPAHVTAATAAAMASNPNGSHSPGRAALCRAPLAQLNPYVRVTVGAASDLSPASLVAVLRATANVTVCVITLPLPEATIVAVNDACRAANICFIYATCLSVFGMCFCDFGAAFVVADKDGEAALTAQIESVVLSCNPAVVKVLEDHGRHGLETGDVVQFSRLQSVPGLDPNRDYAVTVTGPYTFELNGVDLTELARSAATSNSSAGKTGGDGDGTAAHAVNQQGYISQIKQPVTIVHQPYQVAVVEAVGGGGNNSTSDMMLSDFAKCERPALLHLGMRAVIRYLETHGVLPAPGDAAAAAEVCATARRLDVSGRVFGTGAGGTGTEERILQHLSSGSRAVLSPMCAAMGGLVGQEVLKACSGKFTPIAGFFYLDADETLPDALLPVEQLTPSDAAAATENALRYTSQIAVFGKDMQEKFCDLQYFLIGAGAIGCEMLKNWALMGVGCGPKGHVYITDMDRIEKSNLSRQFLFRNTDINEFKSSTAARAASVMNPDMRVTAYQEKVAADTEHLFGDDFYDKLSGVCTALDNVEARLYVDQRCVFYRLPMLESGTLGTKGNTQVVIPHLTENYGATRDPPEKSIPVCTLKNFPNQIQHTLQWARDWFEGDFKQSAEEANAYLSAPSAAHYLESLQPNTKTETLRTIQRILKDERPATFEDCVAWARLTFEQLFHNQILQLLHNFPENQVTSAGTEFWSGSKRCPKALEFDADARDEDAGMRNHLDFVVAAANLRAEMFGIQGRTDEEYFCAQLRNIIVPDFAPQEGVKIAANEEEAKQEAASNANSSAMMDTGDTEADDIWNSLPKPESLAGFRLQPIEFDKDIDEHMLFVTACSNLRALNYSIPAEDTHRSRAIAGRIIPAIATTTALVTGLICLELYKIVGTPRKTLTIEAYKNAFINLAIPFMTLSEPTPPAKTKALLRGKEWEWTSWDSLDLNLGDITMGEFMEHFETEHNLEISMLSHGVSMLYSFFANKKKVEERRAMKMTEVIASITKKEFPPNQLFIILEVIATDKDTDEEVELPYVKFRFR